MKPTSIIVHHEWGSNGFWEVDEYHRQLWNFKSSLGHYIGYQYYVDKTGKVWRGRADDEEGAHTIGRNQDSIGICLEGNFDLQRPTALQMISLKNLILKKMTEWAIKPDQIFGHRTYAPYKSCPGKLFKDSELKELFQPDISYYQSLLDSLKNLLLQLKMRRFGSSSSPCITKESRTKK